MDESMSAFDVSREDFPIIWPVQTRWSDNDHYGHVNNAAYYLYIDTAVNGWLMTATEADTRDLPQIGVVVSNACTFLAPVSFPELLEVGIATSRVGHSSIAYQLAIFRAQSEELCAVAKFVHVYVDRLSGRPDRIPNEILRAVAELPSIHPLVP